MTPGLRGTPGLAGTPFQSSRRLLSLFILLFTHAANPPIVTNDVVAVMRACRSMKKPGPCPVNHLTKISAKALRDWGESKKTRPFR